MLPLALTLLLSQAPNPYAGVSLSNPLGGHLDPALSRRIWARTSGKQAGRAPKAPFSATDFKPVQPRSVARALVSGSKGLSLAQGQALVDGLDAGLDAFEQEARKHNVAYALAFLIGSALQVLNAREVSDLEWIALAQGINDELAAAPQFKKLAPKQKQLVYETSIVVGALIGGVATAADEAKDAAMAEQAKALAQEALAVFGARPR